MKRLDFIKALGVASVAALVVAEIPYRPAAITPESPQIMAFPVKISRELFDDKDALNRILKNRLTGIPKGWECLDIQIGFDGDDFQKDLMTVNFRLHHP